LQRGEFCPILKKQPDQRAATAKFWDFYTHLWRQHRHSDAGGFFTPVDYAQSVMPGMRGLQHRCGGKKRVVFQRDDRSTRQLCPILKLSLENQR